MCFIRDTRNIDEFKRFIDGTMPFICQIDYVCDNIANSPFLDDKDYKGLGYIELTSVISDADAKQKILDGRYLTGSISATTDRAVCSVCKQDWIDEGKCEHDMGQVYDGTRAFIIAGEFEYEEYSYVNDPADTLSQNIELVEAPLSDKVKGEAINSIVNDAISVKTHTDRLMVIEHHDSLHFRYDYDAWQMLENQGGNRIASEHEGRRVPKAVFDLHEKLHKEAKDGGFDDAIVLGTLDRALPGDLMPPAKELSNHEDSTKEKDNKMPVNDAEKNTDLENQEAIENTEDNAAESTETPEVNVEDADTSDVEDSSTTEENQEDASTEETDEGQIRDEESASEEESANADESIEDAVHFTDFASLTDEELDEKLAAINIEDEELSDESVELIYEAMVRELDTEDELKDAKLSSKARKKLASSTFCGPKRSFPVPDCAHVTAARRLIGRYKGPGSKETILACVARKAKALGCGSSKQDEVEETPNINSETCETCASKQEQLDATAQELTTVIDHLGTLREEISMLYKDYADMHDRLIQAELITRNLKAERIADYKVLSGEKLEDRNIMVAELIQLEDTALNMQVESVDMTQIVDKLNSGISRSPSETVSNPAQEANNQVDSKNVQDELPEAIKETYQHLMDTSGPVAANKMIRNAVKNGYLDESWLEKLS
jgi:hypothetical protein